MQLQFVFKDNVSFLRMHKASKFGDDLTNVRDDFKYVNKYQKSVRTFSQGRTAHGFRNSFPVFNQKHEHIGAIEISFSSEKLQWYLNKVSDIHSHFIVNKSIFKKKAWEGKDLVLNYEESTENKDFMLSLPDHHIEKKCFCDIKTHLGTIKNEIAAKMTNYKLFNTYLLANKKAVVITFLPIKNMENDNLAWIVSYTNSPIIRSAISNRNFVRGVGFFISLVFILFIIKLFRSKQEIESQNLLLNDILNSTSNLMFITDFKNVKYTNKKFLETLSIRDIDTFNKINQHDLLNIFTDDNGYLSKNKLQENESFISLIKRTSPEKRIVSILDRDLELKAFHIDVTRLGDEADCLVTLTDITKMQEHHLQTEEQAYIDALTKVNNRNKFNEIFESECKNMKRYGGNLSIAIFDIDKFKLFNDRYGHLIGDEVLVSIAQNINNSIRETDTLARWGGEEFIILFKNTSSKLAQKISNALRKKIELNMHPTAGKVTASFGITEYKKGDTQESIFKRCDKALYLAKKNGRNRVEVIR